MPKYWASKEPTEHNMETESLLFDLPKLREVEEQYSSGRTEEVGAASLHLEILKAGYSQKTEEIAKADMARGDQIRAHLARALLGELEVEPASNVAVHGAMMQFVAEYIISMSMADVLPLCASLAKVVRDTSAGAMVLAMAEGRIYSKKRPRP